MKHLNIITSNLTLKVLSLIMGYTFWFTWSQTQTTSYKLNVPLCVYNVPDTAQFTAPETVKVQISGKLQDLYDLDLDNLAVHIDGATLHEGNNQCVVQNEQLFAPDAIKMVHCAPSNILISYNTQKHDLDASTIIAHASTDQDSKELITG